MKPFEVRLVLPVVVPLLDVIKDLMEDLRVAPAVPAEALPNNDDPELSTHWRAELITGQSGDLEVFASLFFGDDFQSEGVIAFDATNAEAIVRSCASLRLRLRERYLKPLGDEALEAGAVEMDQLDEPLRKAFTCYLFLATIQELVIQHMEDA